MYLYFPKDQSVTRCVIHIGYHMHPILEGTSRKEIENLKTKVADMLGMAPESRPKAMRKKIAKDIVLEAVISSSQQNEGMIDKELTLLFEKLLPNLGTTRLYFSFGISSLHFFDCVNYLLIYLCVLY